MSSALCMYLHHNIICLAIYASCWHHTLIFWPDYTHAGSICQRQSTTEYGVHVISPDCISECYPQQSHGHGRVRCTASKYEPSPTSIPQSWGSTGNHTTIVKHVFLLATIFCGQQSCYTSKCNTVCIQILYTSFPVSGLVNLYM